MTFLDFHPEQEDFRKVVLEGLSKKPKQLPSKFLYDQVGSGLFDEICQQPEYYQTFTEIGIIDSNIGEICSLVGEGSTLIEYGSGHSRKIRVLIEGLRENITYAPVDISAEFLRKNAEEIQRDYPRLNVVAVCADFLQEKWIDELEDRLPGVRRVVFFPGSTIGNFEPDTAKGLLRNTRRLVGMGGGLLIGVDLKKSPEVLTAAYNDKAGKTAEFELNYLHRLNRELGANFNVEDFEYRGEWLDSESRIEMSVVARAAMDVEVAGQSFSLAENEVIHLENSYKFTVDEFCGVAEACGFQRQKVWMDTKEYFAVMLFSSV